MISIYKVRQKASLYVQSDSIRAKLLCDFAYFIYANNQPEKVFCQFISNRFEVKNGIKMTLKRRSFLSAFLLLVSA